MTGAASGIGRAIALASARQGAELFLVDVDEPNLRASASAAEKFGSRVVVGVCDLSQSAQVTVTVNNCQATFGGLDILVNSAGVVHYGPGDQLASDRWDALMSVNLLAPIQLVRGLLAGTKGDGVSNQQVCHGWLFAGAAYRICRSKRRRHGALPGSGRHLDAGQIRAGMIEEVGLPRPCVVGYQPGGRCPEGDFIHSRQPRSCDCITGGQLIWRLYRLFPALVLWLFSGRPHRTGSEPDELSGWAIMDSSLVPGPGIVAAKVSDFSDDRVRSW